MASHLPHRKSLSGDDVVFMYPAADPSVYTDYGCTFLAWGGAQNGHVVRQLDALGVHSTGSLWCLTAGAENLHKNADLRDAVCRDIHLNPIPVWWLFDNTFESTPTWFGCTNHPAFRAFVRQRVAEEMRGGAPGLHVDDHLGTAHCAAFLGGCFCNYCITGFRGWLQQNSSPALKSIAQVSDWNDFDFRTFSLRFAHDDADYQLKKQNLPLFNQFLDFQLQAAALNVKQLGDLASQIVQHPITLSANTALPELPHVAVTPHLSHLVGEVPHNAEHGTRKLLDAVHAYRMAETIGKPLAATAKGQDWAWIKEKSATTLAKIWIALGYCAGQRLMAPHRQWCFTLQLGSHWYDGPAAQYAPLYRFVRSHPHLFTNTTTVGPLAPPPDAPTDFDTFDNRNALQTALSHGDPRPLQTGSVWIFPRKAHDGSLIIHLLNLDYHSGGDQLIPCNNLPFSLTNYTITSAARATVFSFDAAPVSVAIHQSNNMLTLTLPEIRLWSVIHIPAT